MVTLGAEALDAFPRFSLYNSPYIAHREGRAIDLYPGTTDAPSPVAGTVIETERQRCPSRQYAADHDVLIVVDTGDRLARVLHVEPTVGPGETVAVGDSLGTLIRSGYFAPWVANHVHLGFREYGTDVRRASGSLSLEVGVEIEGVAWDGTGTVVETGETYTILDGPTHPDPGEHYVGLTDESGQFVLDGGMPHYENGGLLPVHEASTEAGNNALLPDPNQPTTGDAVGTGGNPPKAIRFLGTEIGVQDGEELPWQNVRVYANGQEITGLSFFLGRDTIFGKLITRETTFEEGESVEMTLASEDTIGDTR